MSELLAALRAANPGREILDVRDPAFATYGKAWDHIKVPQMREYIYQQTAMPEVGDEYYEPSCPTLMEMDEAVQFTQFAYGEVPCQVGYYNGWAGTLDALEYHKCSETLVEFEPVVLILGHIWDIRDDAVSSDDLKLFFVPSDQCVELYATTLHFSPLRATDRGVRQIVCQTATTNTPLHHPELMNTEGENRYLYERNKWVLIHPEAAGKFRPEAFQGITGENIAVVPVEDATE